MTGTSVSFLRDSFLIVGIGSELDLVAVEERLLHALVRVTDVLGSGEIAVPEREGPLVLVEVVNQVAHQEVGLVDAVVLVEDPIRFFRALALVELLEDEVLVDLVDVDVEVIDGVGVEIDDVLGEALATDLLRVREELGLGIELRRP